MKDWIRFMLFKEGPDSYVYVLFSYAFLLVPIVGLVAVYGGM